MLNSILYWIYDKFSEVALDMLDKTDKSDFVSRKLDL